MQAPSVAELKALREKASLTQRESAELSGVAEQTWRNGEQLDGRLGRNVYSIFLLAVDAHPYYRAVQRGGIDVKARLLVPAPTPQELLTARAKTGLTQVDAAKMAGLSWRGWQNAEAGLNVMRPAAWVMFLLATGQHPTFELVKREE